MLSQSISAEARTPLSAPRCKDIFSGKSFTIMDPSMQGNPDVSNIRALLCSLSDDSESYHMATGCLHGLVVADGSEIRPQGHQETDWQRAERRRLSPDERQGERIRRPWCTGGEHRMGERMSGELPSHEKLRCVAEVYLSSSWVVAFRSTAWTTRTIKADLRQGRRAGHRREEGQDC